MKAPGENNGVVIVENPESSDAATCGHGYAAKMQTSEEGAHLSFSKSPNSTKRCRL